MRWSEAELAAYLRRGQPAPLSEAAVQAAVVRVLKHYDYLVYHTFNSKRSEPGFPDLVCAKAGRPLLCLELKTDTGQVTPAQAAWLDALGQCTGAEAQVLRPSGLEAFLAQLREGTR